MALVLTIYEDKEIVLSTTAGEVVIHWMPENPPNKTHAKLAIIAPKSIDIFRRKRRDFTRE